jgi:oligoendopeptidase F
MATPKALSARELLMMRDSFILKFEGVGMYCRLMYSANSTDDTAKQLNGAARRATMKVEQELAFVEIELARACLVSLSGK